MPNHSAEQQSSWNAALYDAKHSFVWQHAADLLELLAPGPGQRVLDLGCGTGRLTARIAQSGAHVTGLDSSAEMIQEARRNYPELDFVLADAANFQFVEQFDAVFSNAALHWIRPPERVAECISRTLKAGGRFVAEMGGKGNLRKIDQALQQARAQLGFPLPEGATPWYFPSVGKYASLLEGHSLEVTSAWLFDRPTVLEDGEAGLENWIRMFMLRTVFASGLTAEQRQELIRLAEGRLRGELFQDGSWYMDYRRLRIVAWKRAEPF